MPELPEVETIVRELKETLPGRRIVEVDVIRPDLLKERQGTFRDGLLGRTIAEVRRRGKNVVVELEESAVLVVNLGMTGRLLFLPGPVHEAPTSHPGVSFTFRPEGTLLYDDIRRFGRLERFTRQGWEDTSARLGREPLDPSLTPAELHRMLSSSRSPVRSWLLDQSRLAGVGNLYANEALFLARIHPARPARSLAPPEAGALLRSLRRVLLDAVTARGTTLRDYRTASGRAGGYGSRLRVYGREEEGCVRCNTPVRRIVFGNRSAFFCPRCQPRVP